MRIGIFGGSFDPVHDGHIHLANLAREAVGLDEVWFVPCRVSPHKTRRPPTPGAERLRWLEAALEGLEWAKCASIEIERAGTSYSYLTMRELAAAYPGNDWFWIMGGDQWSALETWRHPEIIGKLASFIVLARNGGAVRSREGYRVHVVAGEHPASSTEIRKLLATGKGRPGWLDERVYRMIAGNDGRSRI